MQPSIPLAIPKVVAKNSGNNPRTMLMTIVNWCFCLIEYVAEKPEAMENEASRSCSGTPYIGEAKGLAAAHSDAPSRAFYQTREACKTQRTDTKLLKNLHQYSTN